MAFFLTFFTRLPVTLSLLKPAEFFVSFCPILRFTGTFFLKCSSSIKIFSGVSVNIAVLSFLRPPFLDLETSALGHGFRISGVMNAVGCDCDGVMSVAVDAPG